MHKNRNRSHLLLNLFSTCVYALCTDKTGVAALTISPPSSASDYRELASLLASTFDAPVEDINQEQQSLGSKLEVLRWNLVERSLTEENLFKQYTSTVRRMRGKKYCLLVAKESLPDKEGSVRDDVVVGMVEMGLSLCPVSLHQMEDFPGSERISESARPQATLGVLSVKQSHQRFGVGKLLVQKCEEVAAELWGEQGIFVDVEPHNQNALSFFERCGYEILLDENGVLQVRNATVTRRRAAESRPHYFLSKRLPKVVKEKNISEGNAN